MIWRFGEAVRVRLPEKADRFLVRGLVDQDVAGEVKDIPQGGGLAAVGAPHLPLEGLVVFLVAHKTQGDGAAL